MTEPRFEPKTLPAWRRWLLAFHTEFVGVHPRLHAFNAASRFLPRGGGGELRAELLRRTGFSVGNGTRIDGLISITGPRGLLPRLVIGEDCVFGANCMLELSEHLTIGDRVTLEAGVMILTSTHELDTAQHRAGRLIASPVSIGNGVLLRARSVVLPGVKIGDGAVVDAGAVVNKDVPANVRVAGMPAVVAEQLPSGNAG